MPSKPIVHIVDTHKARHYMSSVDREKFTKLLQKYIKAEKECPVVPDIPEGARTWQVVGELEYKGVLVADFDEDVIYITAYLSGVPCGTITYTPATEQVTWPLIGKNGEGLGIDCLMRVCKDYNAMKPKDRRRKPDGTDN